MALFTPGISDVTFFYFYSGSSLKPLDLSVLVCVQGRIRVKADVSCLRLLTSNLACGDFDIKVG